MDLQQILNQKQKDAETLNAEIKKVDEYRANLITQLLKISGAIDTLQALLKAESEANSKKEPVVPADAPAVQ